MVDDVEVWLGCCMVDSVHDVDAMFGAIRMYDEAVTAAQVRGNLVAGPDQVGLSGAGTFSLLGSGRISTNGVSDRFHFEAQSLGGSTDFRVKVEFLAGGDPSGTAGLMIRATAGSDSPHASIGVSPDGTARFTARVNAGG